jgi:MFS family permease
MAMERKSVIRRYCTFQFFFSLLLWVPIFYEFQKRIGLSDTEIFAIQSLYYVVFAFIEIPTGFLADRFGTRLSMRAGALSLVIANLLPILSPSYSGMLSHFLLIALARSLISGASSAYVYDYLKSQGQHLQYKRIEGLARAYGLYGKVICWAAVGVLMEWHLYLPYWLTAGTSLISVVFAFTLPGFKAPDSGALPQHADRLLSRLKNLMTLLTHSPRLVLVMLQGVGLFVLVRICQVNLFQPVLSAKDFDLASFGIMMSLMTIFEAIGSTYPAMIQRWISDLNAVFFLSLAMAASIFAIPYTGQAGTIAALCLFSLIAGLAFPIQKQLVNDAITDSSFRATLISVESIIDRTVCALVVAWLGDFMSAGRLYDFLVYSAGVTSVSMFVIAALAFILRWRKSGVLT